MAHRSPATTAARRPATAPPAAPVPSPTAARPVARAGPPARPGDRVGAGRPTGTPRSGPTTPAAGCRPAAPPPPPPTRRRPPAAPDPWATPVRRGATVAAGSGRNGGFAAPSWAQDAPDANGPHTDPTATYRTARGLARDDYGDDVYFDDDEDMDVLQDDADE